MKEIRIGPGAQVLMLLAVVAAVAALLSIQAPELRRYMKMRSM